MATKGMAGMRTLIRGQWIVANDGRGHTLLRDGVVAFEGKHIINVGKTFDGNWFARASSTPMFIPGIAHLTG